MRNIFKVNKEERWPALIAFLLFAALNALVISKYIGAYSHYTDNYRTMISSTFGISGFDPFTYDVVSNWNTGYNIYRHPLLAFFMYPFYLINSCLSYFIGYDCAQFIVAVILVFCSLYSWIFLFRIFRQIVKIGYFDSVVLSFMLFSFAYVMLATCVPDHFIISMFFLLLVLYLSGLNMDKRLLLGKRQTILLFFLTAGVSLNNGIKVFIASLFTNGRKFWKPGYLIMAIIIPSALIWLGACMEWNCFEKPKYECSQKLKMAKAAKAKEKVIKQYKDTATTKDTSLMKIQLAKIYKKNAHEKYILDHKKPWNVHTGKPMAKGEFIQWTDVTTDRTSSIIENLFGESLQLHQDYLLQDTLKSRPVIVKYRYLFNYVVESIIILLFITGILLNFKNKFLWLVMSFFGLDMLIHVILGFGINEVYIMSAHWTYVIPIVIGMLFVKIKENRLGTSLLRLTVVLETLFLAIWNSVLFANYMLS